MKKIILSSLAVLLVGSVSLADEASHREAAMRVLEVSQVEKSLEQIKGMFGGMLSQQQIASLELPPEGQEALQEMQSEMESLLADLLTWEEMAEFAVTTYVEVFSEEELNQLADFYESELGQKLIERQPELVQKSMQWAQTRVQERMPELLRRMEASMAELREQYRNSDDPED